VITEIKQRCEQDVTYDLFYCSQLLLTDRCHVQTVAGTESSCRPPWLDTIIADTPRLTASTASSAGHPQPTFHTVYRVRQNIISQHENRDIYITQEYFYIQCSIFIHHMSSQVGLILLN